MSTLSGKVNEAERCKYNEVLNPNPKLEFVTSGDRLQSWKEIADYLKRSGRTVRRWEKNEGLPVYRHQHDKRGSVYAYRLELDAWLDSRKQLIEVEPPEPTESVLAPKSRRLWWAAAAVLVLAACAARFWELRRPATRSTPEALRALARANFGPNAGRTQIQTGIKYLQEAIRLDPRLAKGWSGLATAHQVLPWFGEVPASEAMPQAKMYAERARGLSPSNIEAWRVLAAVSHYYEWDHAASEQLFRKAIGLGRPPYGAVTASWFAEFLLNLRRFEEALTWATRAQEMSPRWLEALTVTGNVHLFSGNPDLAIGAAYAAALEIEPGHGLTKHYLGRAYLAKRRHKEAIEQLRKSNEILGQVPFSLGDLGYALAVTGKRAEAKAMLSDLVKKKERGYYPAFPIAQIHLGLGATEAALDWLDRAAEERNMGYYIPSVDPIYDPIRSHQRFRNLMQRMNLGHL